MKLPSTAALEAEDVVRILNLVGISPEIDDILAQSEKGTTESTMVRALTGVVHSDLQAEGVA